MEASFRRVGTLTRKLSEVWGQQIVIEKETRLKKLEARDLATPGIFMAAHAGCRSKFRLRFPTAGLSSYIPRRSQKRRSSQSARRVRLTIPNVTPDEVQDVTSRASPIWEDGGNEQATCWSGQHVRKMPSRFWSTGYQCLNKK